MMTLISTTYPNKHIVKKSSTFSQSKIKLIIQLSQLQIYSVYQNLKSN
jgi:hypothetical protein